MNSEQGAKPNIVLVLMDNLGWGELGVYGGGILRGAPTPRLDRLAAEGFRALNFNVEAQCTPSRAALMTGRYAVRTGNGTVPLFAENYGLTRWEVTLSEMLSQNGYATGAFGKWHLGDTPGRFPTDRGFDEWYGIPNSSDESFWPQSSRFRSDSSPLAKFEQVMEARKGETPKNVKVYDLNERRTIDRELTERAIDFMQRSVTDHNPFFAYIPYTQLHFPTLPEAPFQGKTGNGDFADVLVQMDDYAGRLLDAIDQMGVRDNTIFIFTSDNGPEMFEPYYGFSGPWRGTYFTAMEGSLRVPFLMRWPG
ncbi:MAG: sulfatase-like hydrolase/transferase, partial [Candidatus Binatus sp.]